VTRSAAGRAVAGVGVALVVGLLLLLALSASRGSANRAAGAPTQTRAVDHSDGAANAAVASVFALGLLMLGSPFALMPRRNEPAGTQTGA
jgi:hypothetical protein